MRTNSSEHRGQCNLSFTVNGRTVEIRVFPMERLLDVLRHALGLTGTKEGCGEGECGSCAILMNGELVNSCLIPALQAADATLTTIEGLAVGPQLSALQQAFLECGGAQCGICTPGMILASQQLLSKTSSPGMDDIREALAGNLCRCTGYIQIFEAVAQAARVKADV
jgi:carbon-monoxide dehydrogenase small subunit